MSSRASIGSWLRRLFTWDGLLPASVWSAPFLIELLVPDNRGVIEAAGIVLPIVAFFIRLQVGRRYIASNRFGVVARSVQVVVFCLGLFVLVVIDAVMVLSHVMPKGEAFRTTSDCIVWAALYATYLTSMAIAMYPGPNRRPAHGPSPETNGQEVGVQTGGRL